MNLAFLHIGWLGALEAALIAFVVGLIVFAAWHWVARRAKWQEGRAIGWASLTAVVLAAGIDMWKLLPLFFVNPGSAVQIGASIAGIHDPAGLGMRVVSELVGALAGVVLAWVLAESRVSALKR